MYGCETWSTTEKDRGMLNKWERRMFKIYGPITDQGVSRNRTYYKLRQLHKTSDSIADIKRKLLQKQLEHVIRMDQTRVAKKSFESSSKGKMNVGKSRLR